MTILRAIRNFLIAGLRLVVFRMRHKMRIGP